MSVVSNLHEPAPESQIGYDNKSVEDYPSSLSNEISTMSTTQMSPFGLPRTG